MIEFENCERSRSSSYVTASCTLPASLREGAIRLSPHCYNTADEVDRALASLA